LKSEGMQPAPERPSSWRTFLKAHWGEAAAADFFTSEVWTQNGLVTYYTLFVIDLKSRRIHIEGSTTTRDESFMAQFRLALESAGIETILTPHRAPNCNAFAERFVRSIKEECLNRLMLFGRRSLHRAIREFVEHDHGERPHQGLGNRIIQFHSRSSTGDSTTEIRV
jgi:hypothetical protein